jgi:hypothetical protein
MGIGPIQMSKVMKEQNQKEVSKGKRRKGRRMVWKKGR